MPETGAHTKKRVIDAVMKSQLTGKRPRIVREMQVMQENARTFKYLNAESRYRQSEVESIARQANTSVDRSRWKEMYLKAINSTNVASERFLKFSAEEYHPHRDAVKSQVAKSLWDDWISKDDLHFSMHAPDPPPS